MKKETLLYENAWKDKKTGKVYRKPKKFLIYIPKIQEKIYKESKKAAIKAIKEYNKDKKKGRIVKANVFGSFLSRDMGVYYEKYQKIRYGSDVDILCITEQGFKPLKKWKFNTERSHSTEYQVDAVENHILEVKERKDAPIHPINFLIHIPGKHSLGEAKKRLPVDEKLSRKKGFKVETWYLDKKAFKKLNFKS